MNKKMYMLMGLLLLMPIVSQAEESLVKSAKRAGLTPIPSNKKALYKLIDPKKVLTKARIALGKQLYYDTRLSKDQSISCASCHDLTQGGADGLAVAIGIKGAKNPHHLNSPTVYNAALFEHQFWDGRSPDLEDQAKGPMLAPFEMGMTPKLAEERISAVPAYVKEENK